jgi:uncharacterized protein YbcC (UPF0753/DUF2309 family)
MNMGQYYRIVNLDKKEYISPHFFGDGAKLMEFGCSSYGMMTGLAILLADGNNRGGGDLYSEDAIIGSWAGDRIVITGDYADEGKFVEDSNCKYNLYNVAADKFTNISEKVIMAMCSDSYLRERMMKSFVNYGFLDEHKGLLNKISETYKVKIPEKNKKE